MSRLGHGRAPERRAVHEFGLQRGEEEARAKGASQHSPTVMAEYEGWPLLGTDLLTSNQMPYPRTPGVSGDRPLPTGLQVRPQ